MAMNGNGHLGTDRLERHIENIDAERDPEDDANSQTTNSFSSAR
jgi:hypothetical protein